MLVEDRGRREHAVRHPRVVGDLAGLDVPEPAVERVGLARGDRVEHEERPALLARDRLDRVHQARPEPLPPGGGVHDELLHLRPVRPVRPRARARAAPSRRPPFPSRASTTIRSPRSTSAITRPTYPSSTVIGEREHEPDRRAALDRIPDQLAELGAGALQLSGGRLLDHRLHQTAAISRPTVSASRSSGSRPLQRRVGLHAARVERLAEEAAHRGREDHLEDLAVAQTGVAQAVDVCLGHRRGVLGDLPRQLRRRRPPPRRASSRPCRRRARTRRPRRRTGRPGSCRARGSSSSSGSPPRPQPSPARTGACPSAPRSRSRSCTHASYTSGRDANARTWFWTNPVAARSVSSISRARPVASSSVTCSMNAICSSFS